jgi:hypothetical protein
MDKDFYKKMAQALSQMQEASKKKMDPVDKDELKGDYKDREDKDIDNDGDEDESDEYLHNRRKTVKKAMAKESSDDTTMGTITVTTDAERKKRAQAYRDKKAGSKVTMNTGSTGSKSGSSMEQKEAVELDELSSEKLRQYQIGNEKDRERLSGKIGLIKKGQQTPQQKKDIAKLKSRVKNDYLSHYKSSPYVFGKDKAKVHASDVKKPSWYKESVSLDEADVYHKHMLKALGKTRLPKNHQYRSAIATNGDFVVHDGGGRVVGRIPKGEHKLKENTMPTVYSRILEAREAKKEGMKQQPMDDNLPGEGAKKMAADHKPVVDDKVNTAPDMANKAGQAGPSAAKRPNDNTNGDKSVINPVKGMK